MIKSCITLTLIAIITTSHAATIILDLFEGAGGDGVVITATISEASNNGVEIMLRNDSTIRAVVTSFAIQDSAGLITQPLTSLDWITSNSITIPGAATISFDTTYGFKASPPPTKNGINAGDELAIMLMDANANEIIRAFNSGDMVIAMHVQSIGEAAISSSYVTKVAPEPSVAMLLGLAGVCMIILRRR